MNKFCLVQIKVKRFATKMAANLFIFKEKRRLIIAN